MTEPGGPAWRQTTFFPFSLTSRLAGARAVPLDVVSPTFESARFGAVSTVNAVATVEEGGAAVFAVNRSTSDAVTVSIDVTALAAALGREVRITESHLLHDDDIYAANTLEDAARVGVRPLEDAAVSGGVLELTLPPVSWVAVALA